MNGDLTLTEKEINMFCEEVGKSREVFTDFCIVNPTGFIRYCVNTRGYSNFSRIQQQVVVRGYYEDPHRVMCDGFIMRTDRFAEKEMWLDIASVVES